MRCGPADTTFSGELGLLYIEMLMGTRQVVIVPFDWPEMPNERPTPPRQKPGEAPDDPRRPQPAPTAPHLA